MVVIGSRAAQYYGLLMDRKCSDWDIICTEHDLISFRNKYKDSIIKDEILPSGKVHILLSDFTRGSEKEHIELELVGAENNSSKMIYQLAHCDWGFMTLVNGTPFRMVMPSLLLAIKETHKYKKNSVFFRKTMMDILKLRAAGYHTDHRGFSKMMKLREKETYVNKHPKLNQSKKDFFNTEGVTYKYDHDSIHQAVARFNYPCYDFFKDDQAEVFCSKDKFLSLDEHYKLGAVVEESIVLAIERCLVPFSFNTPPEKAFLMALEKVCTSITSGWFREYAWENYFQAIELYQNEYKNYVDKFMDGLHNKTIKLHEEI